MRVAADNMAWNNNVQRRRSGVQGHVSCIGTLPMWKYVISACPASTLLPIPFYNPYIPLYSSRSDGIYSRNESLLPSPCSTERPACCSPFPNQFRRTGPNARALALECTRAPPPPAARPSCRVKRVSTFSPAPPPSHEKTIHQRTPPINFLYRSSRPYRVLP
jgi:hypothetical protein